MKRNLPAQPSRRESSALITVTDHVIELGGVVLDLGELEAVHEGLNRLLASATVTPKQRAYVRSALMKVDAELERLDPIPD